MILIGNRRGPQREVKYASGGICSIGNRQRTCPRALGGRRRDLELSEPANSSLLFVAAAHTPKIRSRIMRSTFDMLFL
jgi:hypothetical protein